MYIMNLIMYKISSLFASCLLAILDTACMYKYAKGLNPAVEERMV